MIPAAYIQEWSQKVPWVGRDQVEWDLILMRVLIEIFKHPLLREKLACRGGTVLNRVHLPAPVRFSEDIDLVQVEGGPIGPVLSAFREVLEPLLGKSYLKQGERMVTMSFRVQASEPVQRQLKIKLEVNAREHFTVLGHKRMPIEMESRWHTDRAEVLTYDIHELMGTKMRALHERKKGRDLFDLWYMAQHEELESEKVVACFLEYMRRDSKEILRSEYEKTFRQKLRDKRFLGDIPNLIAPDVAWDREGATKYVLDELIPQIPSDPWKGKIG